MNSNKKTAIIVGVLFIISTVTGLLSVIFLGSILDDSDYLIGLLHFMTKIVNTFV